MLSHPVGMIDDDAFARALAENRRRSEVMAEAQPHGPPHHPDDQAEVPAGG